MLTRYKLYVGSNRYKFKSPSFVGKGSFVLGVALTVTEDTSVHVDVTCFDGSDGSVTVAASGGTAPYIYSLDSSFSSYNSTGVFSGLSISGGIEEGTDQYGGIVVCHKTIYAKDANGRIGHIDVLLQSPVEFEWLNGENRTFHCPVGQEYIVMIPGIDFTEPYLSTTANNAESLNPSNYPTDYKFYAGQTYTNITYEAMNDCGEYITCVFSITVVQE